MACACRSGRWSVLPAGLRSMACVRMRKAPGQSAAKRKSFWPALQVSLPHLSGRGNGSRRENAQNAQRRRLLGDVVRTALRAVVYEPELIGSGANTAAAGAPPNRNKQTRPGVLSDFGQAGLDGAPTTNSNGPGIDPDFLLEVVFSCNSGAFHDERPLLAFSLHARHGQKIVGGLLGLVLLSAPSNKVAA